MVLIAIDKLNRKVLGYLCRNGSILTYCCVECDVEFEAANQLEAHMLKHELRPQEEDYVVEQQQQQQEQQQQHQQQQQQQIQLQLNEYVPNENENEGMEADTNNEKHIENVIPLPKEEIENRLCSEYDLKQCSVPLFRFNYDIDDLKSDSDETSVQSISADEDDEKSNGSAKLLRKRAKTQSPLGTADPQKKLFECEHCSRTFVHAGRFRRHYNSAHPVEKPFVCYLCGSKFITNDELTEHQQHHQPDSTKAPVFPCPTCGKNVQNLKRHLRDHELETAYEVAIATGDNNILIESIDDTLTDNGIIKQENQDTFDANGLQTIGLEVEYIVTSDCDINVLTTSSIQSIVNSIDMDMDIKPSIVSNQSKIISRKSISGAFLCTHCPKRFRLETLLNQHLRNHERPRFPCPVCGKKITKSYKRAHLLRFHRPNIDIIAQQAEQQNDAENIVEEIQCRQMEFDDQ